MSAQLVMAGPGQPVVHNTLHDLESFFYVLVGICVLYDGPSKQKSEADLAECFDRFFNSFGPSVLKTIIIQSDLTWTPFVVKHIHPYFKPLVPLLTCLRVEIVKPLATNERGTSITRLCATTTHLLGTLLRLSLNFNPNIGKTCHSRKVATRPTGLHWRSLLCGPNLNYQHSHYSSLPPLYRTISPLALVLFEATRAYTNPRSGV